MNIIAQEIKNNKRSMIIWVSSMAAIIIVFMQLYPAMLNQAEAYKQMVSQFPKEVLDAFSIDIDTLLSFNGFYGYIFTYLSIALGIMGMNLGIGLFSKEITGKTADFLLTKPLTRTKIVTYKIAAGIWIVLVTNILLTLFTLVMKLLLEDNGEGLSVMLLISLSGFLIQLVFFALGVFLGILRKKIRFIASFSMSVVFAFYLLSMVSRLMEEEILYYLTPFSYFDANALIMRGSYETRYLILTFVIVLVFLSLSYVVFKKKDIHA